MRPVVDVCADFDSGKDGHDIECDGVAHCIYHYMFSLRHEGQTVYIPKKDLEQILKQPLMRGAAI